MGDSLANFVIFPEIPRLKTGALTDPSLGGEIDNYVSFLDVGVRQERPFSCSPGTVDGLQTTVRVSVAGYKQIDTEFSPITI